MNLFKYELYKIFSKKLVITGIALLLALIVSMGIRYSYVNDVIKAYNTAITSGEKQIMISETDFEILEDIISYQDSFWTAHKKQLIALKNTITKLKKNYTYKEKELEYNYLKAIKPPIKNIYSSLWMYVFNHNYVYILSAFLIILGVSPIFSEEYVSKVDALILTSKNGRISIVKAKILAALTFIVIISFTACIFQTILAIGILGNGNWNNPIQINSEYKSIAYPLSMIGYFLIQFFTNLIANIALGLSILAISAKASNLIIPAFTGTIAVVAVPIIESTQAAFPKWLNNTLDFYYIKYIYSDCLYKNFKAFNIFGKPLLYPYLAFILMFLASISCIAIINRLFISHKVSN